MVNSIQFRTAISRYKAERLGKIAKAAQVVFAEDISRAIDQRTPVRSGLARGNNRLALGNQSTSGVLQRLDPSGTSAIIQMLATAARAAVYSQLTWFNNVPYFGKLENGWSRQAPLGVYRISMTDVKARRNSTIRKIHRAAGATFNVR